MAGVLVGDASCKPTSAVTTLLAGNGYVFSYPGFGHHGTFPGGGAGGDEGKWFGVLLVVLYFIGCHLQGTVQHEEQSQLLGKCGMYPCLGDYGVFEAERAGSEIHGSGQSAGEGDDGGMGGRVSAVFVPGIPFLSAYAFLGHEVGEGALQAGGHYGFVVVYHDVAGGGEFNHFPVVAHAELAAVAFRTVQEFADITGFYNLYAVIFIEVEGGFQLVFVVGYPAVGFVVADEEDAFGSGIVGDAFQVEVRIRFGEAEAVGIPTLVPAFHQHSLETVPGGKVYMAQYVGGGGTVARAGVPGVLVHVVGPPDADVSSGLYPGGIGDAAGVVEVQHEAGEEEGACAFGNNHCAPGGDAGSLHENLLSCGPRGEVGFQCSASRFAGNEVHGCIIRQVCLVDAEEEAVTGFQGEGRVYPAELADGGWGVEGFIEIGFIRCRPGFVITGQGEFGEFVHDYEVLEMLLLREFVAESEAVVEEAEDDAESPSGGGGLLQADGQFIVVVFHRPVFSPRLFPGFVA